MKPSSRRKKLFDSLIFLFPSALVRREHLSRRDVQAVKKSLCLRMGVVSLFLGVLLFAFDAFLLLSLNIRSGWHQIEVYGIWSFIGMLIGGIGTLLVILLQTLALFSEKENTSFVLARIGSDLLFAAVTVEMLMMIYTDAAMGFTAGSETLSAGVVLIAILCIIQPAFWADTIILNGWAVVSLVAFSLACHLRLNMGGIAYYLILAIAFPFAGFLVVSVLFFPETNHYCQVKRNEMLTDTAFYDSLTRCKNRAALTAFLEENEKRWESRESNLLLIMFDIDNFKLYNDTFSHLGGDHCLRLIADAVRNAFPAPDLDFYRYGGEEFLLFFELRNPEDAEMIMENLRTAVKNVKMPAPEGAPEEVVTISLGGSLVQTTPDFSFQSLLEKVDSHLYFAKRNGKDLACLDGRLIGKA